MNLIYKRASPLPLAPIIEPDQLQSNVLGA